MWGAMGLSTRPYSVPQLQQLGWAGRVATARRPGTWTMRDAERRSGGIQALRVRSGGVSYWLEYHTNPVALAASASTIGIRGVPGLEIRLDAGTGPLLILDAAPGNPSDSLSFPDPDFVDVALPVGNTFTTPHGVRITHVLETHVHNDYLQLLAEYGAIGGVAFLVFLSAHLWRGGVFRRRPFRK